VKAYLNGVATSKVVDAPGITSTFNLEVDTKGLSHGTHNIQIRAEYYEKEEDIQNNKIAAYSNLIYYDVIVVEEGNNTPVFACRFDYSDGSSLISGTPIINTP